MSDLVFGLDTFGDVPTDDSGHPVSDARAIRLVLDEAVLAEETGVDVLALGEHHRPEFAISSPETVLAGIATRTSRTRAIKTLGVGRFDLIYTTGAQPISARLRTVELYGTKVLPMVRDILAG
ncbi:MULTISPECIES: LLM class flavin-dependent oxidoreductase [Streptomyces]|uniref:LLM class flavin-dependent oxidoreductase n=1 Tax=Streptomyces pratisoli TaxID=3139917 RepID=A0ACC6QUW1_9ACTN|nr:LLM class flavin-dependent oxidoreductase [Streptomyces sp. NBC_00259]